MVYRGKQNELLEISKISNGQESKLSNTLSNELALVWFQSDNNVLIVDGDRLSFKTNQLLCLTEFHKIEIEKLNEAVLIKWNRAFYCILDGDSEVGCKGVLYYGAPQLPVFALDERNATILCKVYEMLVLEMNAPDTLQLEMLQIMLKRILIICTRLYKEQSGLSKMYASSNDLIREYNFLVEKHFRTKHTVKEYADLMYKSPKTLSNLFKKNEVDSPLQFINNRIVLEAKRLLQYSTKSISEISYELGYNDLQSFSRFFKSQVGDSPQKYQTREKLTISQDE